MCKRFFQGFVFRGQRLKRIQSRGYLALMDEFVFQGGVKLQRFAVVSLHTKGEVHRSGAS